VGELGHGFLGEVAAFGDMPLVVGPDQHAGRQGAAVRAGLGKIPTTERPGSGGGSDPTEGVAASTLFGRELDPATAVVIVFIDAHWARFESMIGLDKAKCVRHEDPVRTVDDLELRTLTWVHGFYQSRVYGALGLFGLEHLGWPGC